MVHCVFVGPTKDARLKGMLEDLERRLSRLWAVGIRTVPEDVRSLERALEKRRGTLVSLDPQGRGMDSLAFAKWVTSSSEDLHFLAWGAEGPPKGLSLEGFKTLSLSPMTTSHELARVLLLEQLYRSAAILKGHPYPK